MKRYKSIDSMSIKYSFGWNQRIDFCDHVRKVNS